jgi:hypothetical protein
MVKCPFCHFENEDGALFCEQCKSDLGVAQPAVAAPVAETVPFSAEPMQYLSGNAPLADPIMEEAIPIASLAPNEPITVPIAEIAPSESSAPPAPAPEPASKTEEPPAAVSPPASPQAPTVPEGVAATMPASAILASAGIASTADSATLPPEAQPRLLVLRGQKRNVEYPLYEGLNFVGRADEKPVDIDLEDQEPPDRIWCSRQHALISFEENRLAIEDLNSANGTFVNRARIYPGQTRPLNVNDVIQIGNVQLKVVV